MSKPLLLVDADVLGRRRTGDETYVEQLLRALPAVAEDLHIAAIVRDAALVPEGIEPIVLQTRSQELRMAVGVPRLLRRVRPALAHFVHSLPLRCPVPAVLTVQDLSWERDPSVFGFWDLLTFKIFVRRSVRRAAHVLAISERTKRDLVELYGTPEAKITVTPLAPDSAFRPAQEHDSFLLFVSAIEPRKQPLDAIDAANAVGRKLVVVEAMACGTPVVAAPEPALQEVAGDAAVFSDDLADGVRRALADRERLSAAGLERAKAFSWRETARITADVYRKILAA